MYVCVCVCVWGGCIQGAQHDVVQLFAPLAS